MNDVLNRYYACQLSFFGEINTLKIGAPPPSPQRLESMRFVTVIYTQDLDFLKSLLAKQDAHVEDIHRGLIAFAETQRKALLEAEKTASTTFDGNAIRQLNEMLNFYWAAAACICSLGKDINAIPVGHLDKTTNVLFRRLLTLLTSRLKKQSMNTQLDVVNFLDSYVSIADTRLEKRWRWLLYRSLLPVW